MKKQLTVSEKLKMVRRLSKDAGLTFKLQGECYKGQQLYKFIDRKTKKCIAEGWTLDETIKHIEFTFKQGQEGITMKKH